MDRIIALYKTTDSAVAARSDFVQAGFATDRLDVVSMTERGRVANLPDQSTVEDFISYFCVLLDEDDELPFVEGIVNSIQDGKGVLVVHPRGKVEIATARQVVESHEPEKMYWRVAPDEAQGGWLGEHAAGFSS
jgi:hypothetical protein